MRKRLILLVLAAALLAGCGSQQQLRGLEDIPAQDPDKVELYNNVDQHANLVVVCIHGVAFVTTTRDYNAVTRVAELDRTCPGAVTK
jgi:outer membrane lipopolysaccharide assembly protein LptE/RlpB